jgi:hypothetical protein
MNRAVKISAAIGSALLVIVAVAVGLAIASIGGGDDAASSDQGNRSGQQFPGSGPPGGAPPSGADQEAFQAFRDCLAKQGVELPDPRSQGGQPPSGFDPNDPNLQKAFSACRGELPEGAGPP